MEKENQKVMAVMVSVGDVYTEIKRGVSAKGEWAIAIARAEKGYDAITVSIDNPQDLPEECYAIRVDEIKNAFIKKTKSKDGSRWFVNYYCTAVCSSVEGGAVETDPFANDDGVPF